MGENDMSKLLTAAQVEQYHRRGIVFPVPVLSPGEIAHFRGAFEEVAARLGGRPVAQALGHTQSYFRWAYDLATHPRILDAVEDVLGPNLLVWTVSIFPKYPRDPGYISWHQDGTYWGLVSTRVVTAWVALTDSTLDNGCMRVVPGSHLRPILPHRDTYAADNRLSRGQEIEVEVAEQDAVDVVLRAGEMSLHHVNIIHGSNSNPSDGSRIGFAPRFMTPETRQIDGEPLTAVLARGRDSHGHFQLLPGPPVLGFDEALAAQQAAAGQFLTEIRKTRGHYAAGAGGD
jgi:ectoine hydroxylase-related dioxygenase (phytanoyl-CoA dioxygenase family)